MIYGIPQVPGETRKRSDLHMKPQIEDKATITVQEALNHYCLSPRKFYATLHLPGLSFVVFYYDGRRLIIREEFEKYLAEHPELRRRGFNGR